MLLSWAACIKPRGSEEKDEEEVTIVWPNHTYCREFLWGKIMRFGRNNFVVTLGCEKVLELFPGLEKISNKVLKPPPICLQDTHKKSFICAENKDIRQ